ncbi:MAG TPA: penicillin-binding transpeptidase domain-containing protein [Candidatus Limnocylindria bacterium]|nr:penicillin-binding transpeptidase domain-containing protein [Candidatus Limnocylindria bacterium]
MIATNIRRLAVYLLISFAAISAALAWWQVIDAPTLAARQDNPEVIAARRSALRGSIFDAQGRLLASSQVIDGISRRTYVDPAFSHVIGYASLRFGTTGVERAWDDLLTGRADPNPITDLVNDILARRTEPRDLTLTTDKQLQDFAAAQLGSDIGAVVALDPATGAILAMTSTPSFDATPISGDPAAAAAPMEQIQAQPNNPLVARARQGRYTPGSIMKVVTAASALDAGVITPQTTFPDQPREEREGFVVEGFRVLEHDLGNIQPELWPLSPALQVSSNIFFAHVGLELGGEAYLDYARRFGFCDPLSIGTGSRGLPVIASYVTAETDDGDCAPFSDRAELAQASFGQGRVDVTPVQMALVAATIANGGAMPEPFVVRDVRAHAEDPAGGPSERIVERYDSGEDRVVEEQAAAETRTAMVDAVNAQLGRVFAGGAALGNFGVEGAAAGKTGTAERGPDLPPHSWFIGFAPAQDGATPSIAVAVVVEGGGSGSGRAAPVGGAVMAEWLRIQGGG